MAATLFADPPVATMEEAREHFVAAETLKPDGWIENRQFLAKCNINLQVRKGMYKTPPVLFYPIIKYLSFVYVLIPKSNGKSINLCFISDQ